MSNFKRFSSMVVLIDEYGENKGLIRVQEAKRLAQEAGLDLVEVGKQDNNSVCKIMDEGKWKYEQKKRQKHKKQHTPSLKEVKFGIRIDQHDREIKVNHIKEFLLKMHPVNIVVKLRRGREQSLASQAYDLINGIINELERFGKVDGKVKRGGQGVFVRLVPIGHGHEYDKEKKNEQIDSGKSE